MYLYSLRNRPEKHADNLFFYPFLKVIHINNILSDNINIYVGGIDFAFLRF
jgi:hypothetical protein